jgi:hypothetical protein
MQKPVKKMDNKKVHKLQFHKKLSFVVTGISSQDQIFIVANELNKILNISLVKLQTILYFDGENKKEFNAYSFLSNEDNCVYSLLSNHCAEVVLFEKFRMLDYFFIISTENHSLEDHEMNKKIKDSKCFLAVTNVATNNLKEKKIFHEIVTQLWE